MTLKNMGAVDRMARVFVAEILLLVAFFWIGGSVAIVLYVIGIIFLVTAIFGFCPLYRLFGMSAKQGDPMISRRIGIIFIVAVIAVAVAASYASAFFTKKLFLEDFNRMNGFYKQTLFNTGQDKRAESVANYEELVAEYAKFSVKYSDYRPYVIRSDAEFHTDTLAVKSIIMGLDSKVRTGNLPEAHKDFETIRPIFQDILKRNGFSMLSVALVDFHDAMEKVIEPADARNPSGVIAAYPEADTKLKAIEESASDAEIMVIRNNLDAVRRLAEEGKADLLPAKAAELKSSFVKVYLKRG
jgi:hypothetical protein